MNAINAAEFNRLVEQPSLLKDVSAEALRDLVSRYPFCASAHLLLIKKYQLEKHPDFDSRLALTAAYANDRKALYRLLYDDAKFKPVEEEATAVGTHEQRVGTEILLGNESGAFADYTPKNQVAEVETYESMEFVKTGWAEGLQNLENENSDVLSEAMLEQFALASEKAGGGADVVHDFDDLDEENEDELLEEKIEFELESTKALEGALEDAVEEHNYGEFASASNSGAELTHRFDGLAEQNEEELLEEKLDVEIESTKALEDAIEHAAAEPAYEEPASHFKQNGTADSHGLKDYTDSVLADKNGSGDTVSTPVEDVPNVDVPEQQREIPMDPLEHSNTEHEESPSPKEEIVPTSEPTEEEELTESTNAFEPSKGLAGLLNEDYEEFDMSREKVGSEALTEAMESNEVPEEEYETNDLSASHVGFETYLEESGIGEAAMEEVIEEANLPTSVEEHEVKPQEFVGVEYVAEPESESQHVATNLTSDLTRRQEINAPIAEEDLVGTEHRKIPHEVEASYKTEKTEPAAESNHQAVETEGMRTFTDWLKLYKQSSDDKLQTTDRPIDSSNVGSQKESADKKTLRDSASNSAYSTAKQSPEPDEETSTEENHDDTLYDREWKARKLEMESWTAGLPDELKVIDQFVSENTDKQNPQANVSVAELAERSLLINDSFLTETMAKVYASQGKYRKAAEVVEKLMLKNPAKRLYFADLLEDYKKKITS